MQETNEQEVNVPDVEWQEELLDNKLTDLPEAEIETESASLFICDCKAWYRSACKGLPFYREKEGKRYCVLHYPGKEKVKDFRIIFEEKKLKGDFDFSGVWFPERIDFRRFNFQTTANFHSATFSAVTNFSKATFSAEAHFSKATFSAVTDFSKATFSAVADFSDTTFTEKAVFRSATFSAQADFYSATCTEKTDFGFVTFSAEAWFGSATFSAQANFCSATFSAAADFGSATFTEKADFSDATFSALAFFRDATFSALAYLRSATFSAGADFRSATFSAEANFSHATFSEKTDFNSATFSALAGFSKATFSEKTDFSDTTFTEKADFSDATFSAVTDFSKAIFSATADFRSATFKDYLLFSGKGAFNASSLDLQHAKVEKPERISFHSVALYPHLFVNVDSRKFAFTDITWNWEDIEISTEIAKLQKKEIESPHRLFSKACRELALNAEENHLYEEASKFRFMAMEAQRLETWRGWAFWKLRWWYWLASGYGERTGQAALVLLIIWFTFSLLYTHVGFEVKKPEQIKNEGKSEVMESLTAPNIELGHPLTLGQAVNHSFNVMALQRPEPKGQTFAAKSLVSLETALGPLQAALLALAIRRKFMR